MNPSRKSLFRTRRLTRTQSGRRRGSRSVWIALLILSPLGSAHADAAHGDEVASAPNGAIGILWKPASDADLAGRRGGLNVFSGETSVAELGAQVSENQVGNGVETGTISLATRAISEVNGIFLGSINTGNNTSVQTNLNVIVRID